MHAKNHNYVKLGKSVLLLTPNDELGKLRDDKKCVELYPVVTC